MHICSQFWLWTKLMYKYYDPALGEPAGRLFKVVFKMRLKYFNMNLEGSVRICEAMSRPACCRWLAS